jgi:hypothetical protein
LLEKKFIKSVLGELGVDEEDEHSDRLAPAPLAVALLLLLLLFRLPIVLAAPNEVVKELIDSPVRRFDLSC